MLWSKSRRTAISWPFDPVDVWSVNVTNRPLSKTAFFWRTQCWKRRKRSTGHPTKRKRCLMRMRRRRSRIGEAAAPGEMAPAEDSLPACGAAVEKRRALEQIAPDSRLVALRPLHLRVCYGFGLKTLRSVIVANHTGPRARCEKSVPRVVCVVSHKHLCRGLPSALIATVAAVWAYCAVLSQPQNLLTCDSRDEEDIISTARRFPQPRCGAQDLSTAPSWAQRMEGRALNVDSGHRSTNAGLISVGRVSTSTAVGQKQAVSVAAVQRRRA